MPARSTTGQYKRWNRRTYSTAPTSSPHVSDFSAVRLAYIHDARVVLLNPRDTRPVEELRQALRLLASGASAEVRIDELNLVEPLDGISLLAMVGKRDEGVNVVGPSSLVCALTPVWWSQVEGLLDPFAEATDPTFFDRDFFQYLSEEGHVSWIISTSRRW